MSQRYSVNEAALDESYQPCTNTTTNNATATPCCRTNQTWPDVCLGNGLCLSTEPFFVGEIWADGCTDSSGKDEACPITCAGNLNATEFWSVMLCPGEDSIWCCRAFGDWDSCCNNTDMHVKLSTKEVTPLTPEPVRIEVPIEVPIESNKPAIMGGVVGGGLGLIVICLFVATCLLFRKNRRLEHNAAQQEAAQYHSPAVTTVPEYASPKSNNGLLFHHPFTHDAHQMQQGAYARTYTASSSGGTVSELISPDTRSLPHVPMPYAGNVQAVSYELPTEHDRRKELQG